LVPQKQGDMMMKSAGKWSYILSYFLILILNLS
jgi:hypothetical protein